MSLIWSFPVKFLDSCFADYPLIEPVTFLWKCCFHYWYLSASCYLVTSEASSICWSCLFINFQTCLYLCLRQETKINKYFPHLKSACFIDEVPPSPFQKNLTVPRDVCKLNYSCFYLLSCCTAFIGSLGTMVMEFVCL